MSNYIDKDTFQKFLEDEIEETKCDMKNSCGDEYYEMAVESRECALREVLSKLKREPIVDVQEVKCAKWVSNERLYRTLVCSNCHRGFCYECAPYKYCYVCGSKMGLED